MNTVAVFVLGTVRRHQRIATVIRKFIAKGREAAHEKVWPLDALNL